MPNSPDFSQFTGYLQSANSILIILNSDPSFDQQLASASLLLAFKPLKRVSLHGVRLVQNPTISGLDQLKTEMGHQNLRISFNYQETAVNNVSYHIADEEKKFFLTIRPQEGHEPLDKDTINLDYVGAEADLVVMFGVESLQSLDQLYKGYEDLYQTTDLLTIGEFSPDFSSHHLDTTQTSSASEAVAHLLRNAGLSLQSDSATNLLAGIQYQTNNFTDLNASANTFEAVAWLLRSGANRKPGSFSQDNEKRSGIVGVKKSDKPEEKLVMEQVVAEFNKNQTTSFPSKQPVKSKNNRQKQANKHAKTPDNNWKKTLRSDQVARPSGLKK